MLRAQSKRGVNEKTAEPLAAKVRAVEAQYPGDELVELELAEAEIDAGHFDASEAAADRALKANPRDTKGDSSSKGVRSRAERRSSAATKSAPLSSRRERCSSQPTSWTPRIPNRWYEFYQAYVAERVRPTANAVDGLHYASELAPQDDGLRLNSALRYLEEGKPLEAKQALTAVAYDPHGGDTAQLARTMIEKIDSGNAKDALAAAVTQSGTSSAQH